MCWHILTRFPKARGKTNPAPGFRDSYSGDPVYVGGYGFSYSSSGNGNNGVYLDFHMTGLNPSHTSSRAYGFQLRCLSE